jgi:hypothetical protein
MTYTEMKGCAPQHCSFIFVEGFDRKPVNVVHDLHIPSLESLHSSTRDQPVGCTMYWNVRCWLASYTSSITYEHFQGRGSLYQTPKLLEADQRERSNPLTREQNSPTQENSFALGVNIDGTEEHSCTSVQCIPLIGYVTYILASQRLSYSYKATEYYETIHQSTSRTTPMCVNFSISKPVAGRSTTPAFSRTLENISQLL